MFSKSKFALAVFGILTFSSSALADAPAPACSGPHIFTERMGAIFAPLQSLSAMLDTINDIAAGCPDVAVERGAEGETPPPPEDMLPRILPSDSDWNDFDRNNDGEINMPEIKQRIKELIDESDLSDMVKDLLKSHVDSLNTIFIPFGGLIVPELDDFNRAIQVLRSLQELLRMIDPDGSLSRQQLTEFLLKHFDLNGDGVVTAEELREAWQNLNRDLRRHIRRISGLIREITNQQVDICGQYFEGKVASVGGDQPISMIIPAPGTESLDSWYTVTFTPQDCIRYPDMCFPDDIML